ncbi:Zinc finger CCCH domain-containing protein 1 [Acorus calamus]|uniref:Zinc finger CCCH domain-containing protein 1 n=1 Tax=Acorus calamus TaxID=4465 RepID=A0AAV9DKB1_ACOCL|nr:Zinc finger CCCH domain-containing protein 1 [Acorus calamus]
MDASESKPSDGPPADPAPSDPVCSFFRKPSKSKNIRRRGGGAAKASDDDDEEDSTVLHKPKKPPPPSKSLHFSTGRSTTNPAEDQPREAFHFESSSEIQVHHDSRATATLETETEFTRDARAIRERVLKQNQQTLIKGGPTAGEKVYKGMHGYTDYKAGFRREQTVAAEKAGGAHGPLRASAHIRTSARFDYQPDICKDYKETGYCGFGDACKFMHDRGDYKSGWQLEKEWEEKEKAKKRRIAMKEMDGGDDDEDGIDGGDDDDDDEDELPFACFICREEFEDPVVTKCKHYFCEHCALKHHAKNKKCFVCNKPTLGIFNTAHEIRKRMAEKK